MLIILFSFWDKRNTVWVIRKIKKLVNGIYKYRYSICLAFTIFITLLGFYLYFLKNWSFKDVSQVCLSFFIVITLYFAALNYEFSTSKMKQDYDAARFLLTYTTATEWHNKPLTEYQIKIIEFQKAFIASKPFRTVQHFNTFFNNSGNIKYKESLKGVLNSFESLSIGVHKNLIDKRFIKLFYKSIFEEYYLEYYFYIFDHRIKTKNTTTWIYFTNLVEEWSPDLNNNLKNGSAKSSLINKEFNYE